MITVCRVTTFFLISDLLKNLKKETKRSYAETERAAGQCRKKPEKIQRTQVLIFR